MKIEKGRKTGGRGPREGKKRRNLREEVRGRMTGRSVEMCAMGTPKRAETDKGRYREV